jgi:hypothetical protein
MKEIFVNFLKNLKKFWKFVWYDDSFLSYVLTLFFAFIIIKFVFFPMFGFFLSTDYPFVAIVSGSMEHKVVNGNICDKNLLGDVKKKDLDIDDYWKYCGEYYEKYFNISKDKFLKFDYSNGLNIGDVMILKGKNPEDIEIGDVLVFIPQDRSFFERKGPVIHRVVKKWEENGKIYFQTKGDHNPQSYQNFENKIPQDDVLGVGFLRVPYLGYPKIALYNIYVRFFN